VVPTFSSRVLSPAGRAAAVALLISRSLLDRSGYIHAESGGLAREQQATKAGSAIDETVVDAFTAFDDKLMNYLEKLRKCIP